MSEFVIGYRAIQNAAQFKRTVANKNQQLNEAYATNDQLQGVIADLQNQVGDLVKQVEQLHLALAVEKADAAGYRAYVKATKSQNPDISIFADSGQRYKDGSVKSNGALVYEAAFDAEARKLGLRNPAQYRAD